MNLKDETVINDIQEISKSLSKNSTNPVYDLADFWKALSEKHIKLIKSYGFENFKRTVNFEYGQWGVTSLTDAKIRRLFKLLFSRFVLPIGLFSTKLDKNHSITNIRWPDSIDPKAGEALISKSSKKRRHFFVYALYTKLLWQYARLEDELQCLSKCIEPAEGSPLPVFMNNRIISQDLAFGSLEFNLMAKYIPLDKVMRVAEIGAGYGRCAYLASTLYPQLKYYIFDIPPALAISQNYLTSVLGRNAVGKFQENFLQDNNLKVQSFLPHQLELFPDRYFDLVINISSFDEMSPKQVDNYFSMIEQKCKGWLYLKGHGKSRSQGHRLGINEFPYRKDWIKLYSGKDPVVPTFVESIYQLH